MTPRPHPLGVQSHPEWDGVWDRWIANDEAMNPPEPANDTDEDLAEREAFPGRAIAWGTFILLAFTGLLIGALV